MEDWSDFIIIDDIKYNIRVKKGVERTADFLDKSATRVQSGELKRELIGVFFNYSKIRFEKQTDANYDEYIRLYDKLTEPTEFHSVSIGNFSFIAYFNGVSDKIYLYKNGKTYFEELTVNFTAKLPARR